MILIPVAWLLSVMVAGGVGSYIAGQRIDQAYSNPQTRNELSSFMKKNGFAESTTKEEYKIQYQKLSPQDKFEYRKILSRSAKAEDMFSFGAVFVICVIVFSFLGFLSGILTKMWIPAGIFPILVLSLEDPIRQFTFLGYMTTSQKIITILVGQFLTCYAFAYFGVLISKRFSRKKQRN
jgi:hypothetical protein